MKLKILILATAMLGATAIIPAAAGYTCQRIGSFTYCSDNSGNRVSCHQIGRFTYCN